MTGGGQATDAAEQVALARGESGVGRSSRLPHAALLAFGALDAAGYSVIAPTLPAISRAEHAGPALIGALVASFGAAMLIGFGVAGLGVSRGRLAFVIGGGLALIALGCGGFVAGGGLGVYFPARIAMGLGSGGLWIGVTFATLERWPGREYLGMSRLFAAYSVGGLLGPALGALGGVRAPFLAYLLLVCGSLPLVLTLRAPAASHRFGSERGTFRLPGFWLAASGILFAILAIGTLEGVLPLHFAARLSQAQIAGLFVGTSVVVAISAIAAGKLPPRPLLGASVVLVVAGIGLAGATHGVGPWLPALVLIGAGIGMGETAATGILLEEVGMRRMVTAMVVWSQLGLVGYLAGPLAGGGLASAAGFAWVVVVPLAAGLLVGGAFVWSRSRT